MNIDNTIQEFFTSFEVSKLLKEKGFGVKLKHFYYVDMPEEGVRESMHTMDINNGSTEVCSAPTRALAIEWIRVNFNLHIYTYLVGIGYACYNIQKIQREDEKALIIQTVKDSITCDELYNSPQEATEAALLYVLKESLTPNQTK